MRVGWLVDEPQIPGGAELTQAEFRAAAPQGIEVVDCPPSQVVADLDRYVVHNCVQYTVEDFASLAGKPVVKFWHDVGPWVELGVREWLDKNAMQVCCSPLQAESMSIDAICIPPPVDLDRFAQAAESVNGSRTGSVCVAQWGNHGKAPHKAAEWGVRNGGVEFYGGGPLAPPGAREIAYDAMPDLLASYETFVFLPTSLEPFGRVVAEAWAAGCQVVTNGLVGARYWIEENPDAIGTAAEDFWELVLGA